jgi:hypothetical protein
MVNGRLEIEGELRGLSVTPELIRSYLWALLDLNQ